MSNMEERSRYDCSGKWFKGNVHMHTTYSDGGLTPRQAAEFYAGRGYDFMAITDHMVPFVGAESDEELPIMTLDGIELHGEDDQGSFYHAVCIGNVHGRYRSEPRLYFERLAAIREAVSVPLVLHGASGLPMEMVRQSIKLGICKLNVNTEVREAYLGTLRQQLQEPKPPDLVKLMQSAIDAMKEVVLDKIELFGSTGKR